MSSLTHALIVLTSRELNDEIIKKMFLAEDLHKGKNTSKIPGGPENYTWTTFFLFLWETHNAMYWKIKRTSPSDILLLTHYIMRSQFFFAHMHGCSHAPLECRGLHVCATCCVCCGDGASWRWMLSAVWNSADPLKWLLAGTREREREVTCVGNMRTDVSPPPSTKHTQNLSLVLTTGRSDSIPFL